MHNGVQDRRCDGVQITYLSCEWLYAVRSTEYGQTLGKFICEQQLFNTRARDGYFQTVLYSMSQKSFPWQVETPSNDSRKCRVTREKTSGTPCSIKLIAEDTLALTKIDN